MQFGLFGSAAARRPTSADDDDFDCSEGYRDFIDYNVEAEALGFRSTFIVEHHFTGYGQVSATINLLTWLGARTSTCASAPRSWCCPGTTRCCSPSRPRPWTCCRAGGSISASARATATTNSPGSACRWRRPTRASTNASASSSRRGPRTRVLASRALLAVRQGRRRAADRAAAASADLDGRRRRKLGAPGRRARLQSPARPICLARRCRPLDRRLQSRGRGKRAAFRPAAGRRHPRVLCCRQRRRKGGARSNAGSPTGCAN